MKRVVLSYIMQIQVRGPTQNPYNIISHIVEVFTSGIQVYKLLIYPKSSPELALAAAFAKLLKLISVAWHTFVVVQGTTFLLW